MEQTPTQPGLIALQASNLLNPNGPGGMPLVALVNRLDLAEGVTCGEQRLIYDRQVDPVNTLFFIVEFSVPNPNPSAGINGCLPIAQLWNAFQGASSSAVTSGLEELFLTGLPTSSETLPSLARASNLGLNGVGQFRLNTFVNDNNGQPLQQPSPFLWQLFQAAVRAGSPPGIFVFQRETVSNTAYSPLYGNPVTAEPPAVTAARNHSSNICPQPPISPVLPRRT
jgi:hypothetical protein